ncbi:MAG: permease [Crocinitomicaceae bacterium]
MDILNRFFEATWDILLQMSPYLILGFLIAGLLNVVISQERVSKYLGKKGIWTSIKAALIGVPLPLCSCGVIPTGIAFHKNGASKGATTSFLISTPQTGVDSILMTYSMMNLPWAIIRPIIAFITGVIGGSITDLSSQAQTEENTVSEAVNTKENSPVLIRIFKYAFITFFSDISRQLLLGILIAVIITVFVPQSFFTAYMSNHILNMLIILVASIPLYVCATGSVPIAAALLAAGVTPGAVLVFLMAGPATNAATITVLWKSLGKKTTLLYLVSIIGGALIFGILMDYFLNPTWFTSLGMRAGHVHGEEASWIAIISSIVLIGLIIFVELRKLFPKKYQIKEMNKVYSVEGMTCNHCKASVEKNLSNIDNITKVTADPNQNIVIIEGDAQSDQIQKVIDDLGFQFIGEKK